MNLRLENPAFLLALAFGVLPLLAHLSTARSVQELDFPAVRFLVEAHQTLRRRWMLDDLLLLLLRLAAIAAVVGLFCRPTMLLPMEVLAGTDPELDTVVVIDRSGSTGRTDAGGVVFDRIRARALELLGSTRGRVAVVLADQRAVAFGLDGDRADHVHRIERLRAGYGSTDLTAAIDLSVEMLAAGGGQVVVLGDGTATIDTPPGEIPDGIELVYQDLSMGEVSNVFPSAVVVEEGETGMPIHVTVSASGDPGEVRVAVELAGIEPMRGTAAVDVPRSFFAVETPAGLVPGTVSVSGDALPGDDQLPFFLESSRPVTVHLVGGTSGASHQDDDLYFLLRAMESDDGLRPVIVEPGQLARIPAAPGTVAVLANVPCSLQLATDVRRLLEGGGGVLLATGNLVDRDACNRALDDLLPARLGSTKSLESKTYEHARLALAPPDTDEAIWAPFAAGGLSTFGRVNVERLMEVEPALATGARVRMRYTDGRAALLEQRTGPGRLLLFTTTLDEDWNDLPIHAVYLPLVHQMVRYLAGGMERSGGDTFMVGERPRIPLETQRAATLVGPDVHAGEVFPRPELPGHYRLEDDQGRVLWRFAVRTDPAESALRPIDRAALYEACPSLVYVDQAGDGAGGEHRAVVMRPISAVPALAMLVLIALLGEAALGRRR